MNIGYARVSTLDQDTALQINALRANKVTTIFHEKGSSTGPRPQLQQALATLKEGDILVVWKLDRIARSLPDLLSILDKLKKRKIGLKSLTEPIDTSSPIGEFMIQVLGAVGQLEKAMIRERVIAGQVTACLRGVKVGRPSTVNDVECARIIAMHDMGSTKAEIARDLNVSRHVVYRVLGVYSNPNHKKYGPRRHVIGPLLEAARASE